MKVLKEFKEFAVKGNMIDIAIGVIIGSAFNKVIDVIVKDIIMPPLNLLTGSMDFSAGKLILRESVVSADGVITSEIVLAYGKLFNVLIDFIIIAFTIFLVVKFMNRLRNKAQDSADKTVNTPKDIELLHDLKELMEAQNELLKKSVQ
ncbi:MAG: large conductance mechanosensitive channel protein MscL [Flavobacteriales bacterium]|jgi:large conductance mechanosensitive channel|tara:strand:- start:828 stop:1271 length:444 start_codon:yes stop_codon:yes gene_type:complete